MELPDAAQLVVVRSQPPRPLLGRPATALHRVQTEWGELVERERPVRGVFNYPLDTVQLGVTVRIAGFFPGFGPLEGGSFGVFTNTAGHTRCFFTYNPPQGFALIFDVTLVDDGNGSERWRAPLRR